MKRFQLSLWVCLVVCFGFSTYAQDTKENYNFADKRCA